MQSSINPRNHAEGAGVGLAKGLGLFSFGLGLAEIAAPRALARLIGVDDEPRTRLVMRLFGAREVLAGLGIFARPRHPAGTWARIAGDALDIGTLVYVMSSKRSNLARLTFALANVAAVTALDVLATKRLHRARGESAKPVTRTITINKRPQEVYEAWRDFSKLPQFMSYVESVEVRSSRHSHWIVKTPVGVRVGWDAEITEDIPGERIAWHTVGSPKVPHRGCVSFKLAPDGRRTEVIVELQAPPVGGGVGDALGKLLAGPQIEGDLRRFKQVLETGELVRSDASIHTGMHPARPSNTDTKGA